MNKREVSVNLIDDLINAGDDLADELETLDAGESKVRSWDRAVDKLKKETEGLDR